MEILTPTEGVDFSTYIARVLASVKRNWYSVMPESARLGDKGKVVLQFRIMQNGVVPDASPSMCEFRQRAARSRRDVLHSGFDARSNRCRPPSAAPISSCGSFSCIISPEPQTAQ